jgi:16S rRNA (guanine966-N2)-methyltransferase
MRIISGTLGGRRLTAPRGRDVRPTSERVREALFNRLGPLPGGAVLDLFAGSGALGFEALSRGAASCLFADDSPAAIASVRANIAALALAGRARVRRGDFQRVLRDEARVGNRYDLVLLDPPYAVAEGYAAALGELVPAVLAPRAVIVIESARGLDLALDLPADPPRRYGASTTQIIRNGP